MRLYLALKYHPDNSNRPLIDALTAILEQAGFETFCFVRDVEGWGAFQLSPQALMQAAAAAIDASDGVIVETSEKGVGLGIEAGYAYAKGIPVFTLARQGADISTTLQGISTAMGWPPPPLKGNDDPTSPPRAVPWRRLQFPSSSPRRWTSCSW